MTGAGGSTPIIRALTASAERGAHIGCSQFGLVISRPRIERHSLPSRSPNFGGAVSVLARGGRWLPQHNEESRVEKIRKLVEVENE